jgi:predicted HicB family RNase H-like nuclease
MDVGAVGPSSPKHGAGRPRPVQQMRTRVIRVNDALWLAAQARAAVDGESLAAVIRRALVDYIDADVSAAPAAHVSVPGQPMMCYRSFRVADNLYCAAQQAAQVRGDALSEVIRRALERYVLDTRIG